jgi:hypothetical protein
LARYCYYGSRTNWGAYHGTKRDAVSIMYGGIDSDLLKIFLNLDHQMLHKVFSSYSREHGPSAASYARKTYTKWQSGSVKPSGKTLERLVSTLPPLLSFNTKCELLRRLRERNRQRENHNLTVDTTNWAQAIAPLVSRIVSKAYTAVVPEIVERRLEWLADGDMQAAKAILAEAEAQEGRNAVVLLKQEFQNIERIIPSLPRGGKVTHAIELPYGRIHLTIKRNKYMANENKSIVPKSKTESLFRPTAEDIFDTAFDNLDREQASNVSNKAAEEAIRIVAEKKRSEQKFDNAKKDIGRFIENANEMDRASGVRDYSMSGAFESASGTTNIQVSRQRSKTAIVIAVVVGLVLLLYFLSRH